MMKRACTLAALLVVSLVLVKAQQQAAAGSQLANSLGAALGVRTPQQPPPASSLDPLPIAMLSYMVGCCVGLLCWWVAS